MNKLPCAFYESLFWVGCTTRAFVVPRLCETAKELPGNIGIIAQKMTSQYKIHGIAIRNNRIIDENRWDRNGAVPKHLWIEKNSFVHCVSINIFEGNEDKASREIINRISFPNAMYCLDLQTATVNKAWMDWACTSKRLKGLSINTKLDAEAIVFCKRLIETEHLKALHIGIEESSEVTEMVKLALTQPQSRSLRLMKEFDLDELIVFWSQNKEALRGKDLYYDKPDYVPFWEEKLELCPQEEFEPIGRHYFYFPRTIFFGRPSHPYKLKYGGDDEDNHGAYVFFDCVKGNPNESEMRCFTRTALITILFT